MRLKVFAEIIGNGDIEALILLDHVFDVHADI